MHPGYHFFAILLALSSATAACVAVLIWQRRDRGRAGAGYLAGVMAAVAFWAFGSYLEMVTVRPETKILWSKIAYLGELPSITFLLLFALAFAEYRVSARTQRWLWAPAVLVIVLAWTNDWHGWVWPGFAPGPAGSNTLIYFHGPAWWAKVVWEYLEYAVAVSLILWRAIRSRGMFRRQAILVLLAISAGLPGSLLYVLVPGRLQGVDTTAITFCVTGVLMAAAVLKTHLFDLVPIAYESVFEHVGEAIVVVDCEGRIVSANAAAVRMLGLSPQAIGRPASRWLPASALAGEERPTQPVEFCPAGQPELITELRTYVVRQRGGAVAGRLVVLVDVTARKRSEQALLDLNAHLEEQVAERTAEVRAAAEQLRELDRLKNAFLANVSHELRTPLANIKLYASLLRSGKPEKHASYLDTLEQQIALLQRLVEQLLAVSHVNNEPRPLSLGRADVAGLLRAGLAGYQELAVRQGREMRWGCEADLPPVWVDGEALVQAVEALLKNAFSYTPSPGWVEVQISRAAQAGRAGVAIEVRDSGEGISGEDLPHLFERFYRGHAALVCGVPGLGMGLASCRATIERLGGRVSARSTPGSGSCFSVWLPACAPEATLLRQTL